MRIRRKFRTLFLGITLLLASLSGITMRPDDIDDMMRNVHQQKIEYILPGDDNDDSEPKQLLDP